MPTPLEIRRQENKARNEKLLDDLMDRPNKEKNANAKVKRNSGHKSTPQKRVPPASDGEMEVSRPTKLARLETSKSGLRRSSRNVGKTSPDYQAESQTQLPRPVAKKIGADYDRDPNRRSGKRIHDPYDWYRQ